MFKIFSESKRVEHEIVFDVGSGPLRLDDAARIIQECVARDIPTSSTITNSGNGMFSVRATTSERN